MSFIKFYDKVKHMQNISGTLPKWFSSKFKSFPIIETQDYTRMGKENKL